MINLYNDKSQDNQNEKIYDLYNNCDTILMRGNYMQKSAIVHTRISPEVKQECDYIFSKLGITTSYAITLFLNQVTLKKGIPFDIILPEKEDLVSFAENVSSVDSNKPSSKAKAIMKLYDDGIIDYETAEFAIMRLHK